MNNALLDWSRAWRVLGYDAQLLLLMGVFGCLLLMPMGAIAQTECFTPDADTVQALGLPPVLSCVHQDITASSNDADYVPLASDDIKTVRVYLHIMQKGDGFENFSEADPDQVNYLWAMFNGQGQPDLGVRWSGKTGQELGEA